MELDGIRNRRWNTERVIVFQMVIFQRVRLVSGAGNLCDCITSCLELWNKGAYDELVQDSYGTVEPFLGNKCGTQIQEQSHCTFSNPILHGKLRKVVRFI